MNRVRRGDLFWADLSPRSGSEQQGRRPVVVVSRDALNRISNWRSVNVVPISTSVRQAQRGLTVVLLSQGTAGLAQDSVVLCHQVTTLDRSKLSNQIGSLPPDCLARVNQALILSLALD
jgi:mRNA interferase MazF